VPNLGCINLFIWDTAGQEMYRNMIKCYYRGVAVAMVVFDVSDRTTFESVGNWFKDILEKQN
jgi:GTPase SAR1 family protein